MPTPDTLTSARHRDFDLEVVAGAWPADIGGEILFSAPVLSGTIPYGIFDFGCMTRLSLAAGTHGAADRRFAWRGRTIQTPGQRIFDAMPEAFGANSVGYHSPFGPPNAANTAPLPWGDRLFATWDGGRPVELHPGTLEFVAEVGHADSWGRSSMLGDSVLPFLLSCAHPVVDPDRRAEVAEPQRPLVPQPGQLAQHVVEALELAQRDERTSISRVLPRPRADARQPHQPTLHRNQPVVRHRSRVGPPPGRRPAAQVADGSATKAAIPAR